MALKRYIFVSDTSDPYLVMDRYIATHNPVNWPNPEMIGRRNIIPDGSTVAWELPFGEGVGGVLSSDPNVPIGTFAPLGPRHGVASPEPTDPEARRKRALLRAHYEDERRQRERVQQRVETTDFFSDRMWAAADADVVAADEGADSIPQRMRTFLDAQHASTYNFIHFCDVELADAHLQEAMKLDLNAINALPTSEAQVAAVQSMYEHFGKYWQALNVRLWGWNKYRSALELAFGLDSHRDLAGHALNAAYRAGSQLNYITSNPNNPGADFYTREEEAGFPDAQNRQFLFNTVPTVVPVGCFYPLKTEAPWDYPSGNVTGPDIALAHDTRGVFTASSPARPYAIANAYVTAGTWRRQFMADFMAVGNLGFNYNFRQLRIGSDENNRHARFGIRTDGDANMNSTNDDGGAAACGLQIGRDVMAADGRNRTWCFAPSGEVHRLWLTSNGTLGGTIVTPSQVDSPEWVSLLCPRPNVNVYRYADFAPWNINQQTFGVLSNARGSYLSFPVRTERPSSSPLQNTPNNAPLHGDWLCAAYKNVENGVPQTFFLPPLLWYAQLIWPLLLELRGRNHLEVIYEVNLDVRGKNTWQGFATGNGAQVYSAMAERSLLASADAFRTQMSNASATGNAALGLIGVVPVVGPILGAIGGVALGAANLINKLFPPEGVWPQIDAFGRPMPTQEIFAIDPSSLSASIDNIIMPPTPPNYVAVPVTDRVHEAQTAMRSREHVIATSSPLFVPPGSLIRGTVRIRHIPEGSHVFIDGDDVSFNEGSAWEGDRHEYYDVTSRFGSHVLRINPPTGAPRGKQYTLTQEHPRLVVDYTPLGPPPPDRSTHHDVVRERHTTPRRDIRRSQEQAPRGLPIIPMVVGGIAVVALIAALLDAAQDEHEANGGRRE